MGISMSIRAVYPTGIVFKKVVSAFKGIVDQIPIAFEEPGFVIEALSPDKVTMIIFEIPASSFEEYTITSPVKVVADRDEFVKAFRRATKRDKVSFEYVEGVRELKIKVFNVRSNVEKEVSIPLSEIGFERIGGIELNYEVQASLPTSEFVEIIKDAALVGDEITFIYSSELNAIKVSAYGELAEYSTILNQFQPLSYLEASISSAIVKYGVDHLKALAKVLDLADECTIAFGPDKPLKITLNIAGGGKITTWVAPRS
jgi:proliferating cell nuclear antigen